MEQRKAEELAPVAEAIAEKVKEAPVKHMDETGYRIGGPTQWLHVAATVLLTFYRTSAKRGALLADVIGIIVHDHWKPYFTMPGVLHALCNAHHLRELKALMEIEKEAMGLRHVPLPAPGLSRREPCEAEGAGAQPALRRLACRPATTASWLRRLAFHEAQPPPARPNGGNGKKPRGRQRRRTGHNLLLRLQSRKDDVLRFLTDPSVPFFLLVPVKEKIPALNSI